MSSSTESVEVRRPHNPARNRRGAPLNRSPWESTTDSSEEPSTSPHPDGADHDGEQSSLHPGDDGRGRSRRDNDDGCRDESGDHRPASRDGRGHGRGLRSPPRRRDDNRARDGDCHHPSAPRNGGHHSSGRRSFAPRCDEGGGTDGRGDRPRTLPRWPSSRAPAALFLPSALRRRRRRSGLRPLPLSSGQRPPRA